MIIEGETRESNSPWRRSRLAHGVPSSDDRGRTGGRCHPAGFFDGEGAADACSWWRNDLILDCGQVDSELAGRLDEVNLGPTSPRQAAGGASSFAARRGSASTFTQLLRSASGVDSHLTSLGAQGPGRTAPAASCAVGNSSAADYPSKQSMIPCATQRGGGALSPTVRPCRRQPESDGGVCVIPSTGVIPSAGGACLQARHAPKPTTAQPGSVVAAATSTSLGVLSVAGLGLTCQPPTPGRLALLARHGDGNGPVSHTLGEAQSQCDHTQQPHQFRRQSNAASRGPQHEPPLLSPQGPQRAGSQPPPHRRSLDDWQRLDEHPQHKHAEPPAATAAPFTVDAFCPMWVVPPATAPAMKSRQKLPVDALVAFLPVPATALAFILVVPTLGVGGRGGGRGYGWEWAQVLPGVQAVCVMSWLQCCWTLLPRGQGGGRRTAVRLTQLAACLLGVVMLLPWGGRYGSGLVAAALHEDGTLDLAELATLLGRLLMPAAAWPGGGRVGDGSGAGQGADQGRARRSAGQSFQSLEEAELQSAAARLQVCLAAVLAVWALQVVAACFTLPPAGVPGAAGPYAATGGEGHLAAALAAQKSHLDLPSLAAMGALSQPSDPPSLRADGLGWHVGRYGGSSVGSCGARGGGGAAGPASPSRAAAALIPGTLSLKSSCTSTSTTAVTAIDQGGKRGQGKEQCDEEAAGGVGQLPQVPPSPQQQQARALSVLTLLTLRLLVVTAYIAQFAVAAALMGVWQPATEVPEVLAGGRPLPSTAAAEPSLSSSAAAASSPRGAHHLYPTPVPWPTVALLLVAMAAPLPLPYMLLSRRCMPFVQHTALLLRPAAGPSRVLGLLLLDVNAAKLLAAVAVGLLLGSWPAGAFTWQLLQVLTLVYGMTKLYLDCVRHSLLPGTVAAGPASKGEGTGGVLGTAGLGTGGGGHQSSSVATPVAGGCAAVGWVAGGERERSEWSLAPDGFDDPRVVDSDGGEVLGLPTTRSVFCGGAGAGFTSSSGSSHPSLSPCSSDHSLCGGSGVGAPACGVGPGCVGDSHHIAARRPLLAAGPQHSQPPHPYQQALQLQHPPVPSSPSCCSAASAAPGLGRNLSRSGFGSHGAPLCLKPDGGGCAGRCCSCSLAAAARCARAHMRAATRPWSLMLGSLCLLASLLWVALIAPPLAMLGDGPSDLFEGLLQTGPGGVTVLALVAGTVAALLAAAACLAWCGMRGELRRRYRLEHAERRRLQCLAWSCGPPLAVAAASGLSWALGEERNAGAFLVAEALRAAALWPLVWLQEPWLLGGVELVGGCVQHAGCGVTCCILRWCRLRPSGAAGPGGRCDVQEGGGGGGGGLEGRERERGGAQLIRGSSGRRGFHAGAELHIEVN